MYTFVKQLTQPFTLSLLLLGVILVLVRRRPGGKGRLTAAAIACYCALFLSAWGPVGHLALGALEDWSPPLAAAPSDAPAVVVLGGGTASLPRSLEAARLYRRDVHTLVLLSGGAADPGRPIDAERMRDWVVALGVDPKAVALESASLSTHENTVLSGQILRARGVTKVVLVTDAAHMRRAAGCFRRQGFDVVPAPCGRITEPVKDWPVFLLPSAGKADNFQSAAREWLGLLWYWAHGRI